MAGIGFELRRILAEDTYTSMVKGFLYSTVISAGPWLMSVLCLGILGIISVSFLGFEERQVFASTVVYMYALSLVGTGLIQVVVTRYLSDQLYLGERNRLGEALMPVLLLTVAIQLPIASWLLWSASLSAVYKISAILGLLIVSFIWQSMIFLSASRYYVRIVLGFFVGSVISTVAGYACGQRWGLIGYLNGFNLGQFSIFACLYWQMIREFGLAHKWDWAFIPYFARYPQLIGIGFCYNLGIWIDKIIFGFSTDGRITANRFPTFDHYDSSMFLAVITVVPAMAIFLSRTETDFADAYRRYYDDIFFRRPLRQILQSKSKMIQVLTRSFLELCKLQGLITFLALYFADDILQLIDLPYSQTSIFRYGLLGSLMQVLMLFIHIILLYFDLRGTVMALSLVFLLANAFCSFFSLSMGYSFYGAGFATACFLSLLASTIMLYWRIRDLEYITFAKREIVGQTVARRSHRARPGGMYGRYLSCPNSVRAPHGE